MRTMNYSQSDALSYSGSRKKIRNADILLYRGTSRLSRLIQLLTRSPYSHAGLAVWWNGRLMVMEAVGKGIVVTPMSANVAHYDGGVEWYQHRDNIPEKSRKKMLEFAQQQLGKEYSFLGLFAFLLYKIFPWRNEKVDDLCRSKRLFCSFYVAQVYNSIGLDLKNNRADRFMSPRDIASSEKLKKVAVLKK